MLASGRVLRDPDAMTMPPRTTSVTALALAAALLVACGGDGTAAAEVASLRAELEQRDEAAEDLEARLTSLEDELELLRSTTTTSVAAQRDELDDVVTATDDLAGQLDGLTASLEELAVSLQRVETDARTAATDREAAEAALRTTIETLDGELAATRDAVEAARGAADAARDDAEAVRGSVVVLGDLVDAIRDRVDRLESARSTPAPSPR
jgi:chromosome segregation ATPase